MISQEISQQREIKRLNRKLYEEEQENGKTIAALEQELRAWKARAECFEQQLDSLSIVRQRVDSEPGDFNSCVRDDVRYHLDRIDRNVRAINMGFEYWNRGIL